MKKSLLAILWSVSLVGTTALGWYGNRFYDHYTMMQSLKIKKVNPAFISQYISEQRLPQRLTETISFQIPPEADYISIKDGVRCSASDGHAYTLQGIIDERKVIIIPTK